MRCIVNLCYWYILLPKITSKNIFFFFLTLIIQTLHILFTWTRMWGSVVIFRSQKGPARKNFGKHCYGVPTIGADATATRAGAYPWCQSNCDGLNKTFNKASRGPHWHRMPIFSKYYSEDTLGQGWLWHAGIIPWHAAFTGVPNFFYF
jgi:hypothetical protein